METVNTPIAQLSFDETEKILSIKVLEDAEMNLKNAKIHYEAINILVNGSKYLALVDATNYYSIEKEAWQYASTPEVASNRLAVAHYNSSVANKLTTSFFKAAHNSSMPMQIFDTKEEAVKWLKSISNL